MKNLLFILSTIVILSCTKAKEKAEEYSNAAEALEKLTEGSQSAKDKMADRRAKGDTLPMNYKDLQAFLPAVNGFEKDGSPSGETVGAMGMNVSNCEQNYKSGDKNISIKINDFNNNVLGMMGFSTIIGANITSDNDQKSEGPVKLGIDGVGAHGTDYKKEKRANLVIGAAERFIIEIKGDASLDELIAIAKSMDLAALAAK
jgi:hypothetical protein